ncbi:MAG: hypothetical protein AAFV25_08690 [Bacteroidota bacterium]
MSKRATSTHPLFSNFTPEQEGDFQFRELLEPILASNGEHSSMELSESSVKLFGNLLAGILCLIACCLPLVVDMQFKATDELSEYMGVAFWVFVFLLGFVLTYSSVKKMRNRQDRTSLSISEWGIKYRNPDENLFRHHPWEAIEDVRIKVFTHKSQQVTYLLILLKGGQLIDIDISTLTEGIIKTSDKGKTSQYTSRSDHQQMLTLLGHYLKNQT